MTSSDFGVAEVQRRKDIRVKSQKVVRIKNREKRTDRIFTSLKRAFTLLLMTTMVTSAYSHREGIERFVSSKMNRIAATHNYASASGMLRQSALNHEKEVDEVIQ